MPITPVEYVRRPYVGSATLGQLVGLRGQHEADAIRQRGDIAATLWSNLGQQVQQALTNYAQQKERAPILEQERQTRELQNRERQQGLDEREQAKRQDSAFMALLEQQPNPDPKKVLAIYGPQRGLPILTGLKAFHATPDPQDLEAKAKVLQDRMIGLHALSPEVRAQVYPAVRQKSIADGLITEQDAPPQYDDAWWTQTVNYGRAQSTANPTQASLAVLAAAGDTNAQKALDLMRPPGNPPAPVRVETMENGKRVTKFLPPDQVTGQTFEAPPPAASASGPTGATGLDDAGTELVATQYRILGAQGIPTRIGEADRDKIIIAAAAQIKALGNSPAQAIQKQFAMKADAAALTKITAMASAAEAFENKAVAQTDIVRDLSKKVGRTASPLLNSALLAGKADVIGDKDTQLLFNAITTFSTEYAKIMEGSTGSVAASSDSARAAAARLVKATLNDKTLQATLDLMQKEMRLTIQGYGVVIGNISDRMGGPAPATAPPPAAGGRQGGAPTYQDYLRSRGQK